jgi:hypothetical protein
VNNTEGEEEEEGQNNFYDNDSSLDNMQLENNANSNNDILDLDTKKMIRKLGLREKEMYD